MKTATYHGALATLMALAALTGWAAEPIRPISNPVHVDSAEVSTQVHPIFMHHRFPSQIDTELGRVPVGGDLQLYAVQLEYAFTKDLSLIAVKDGYVDFNPDDTLTAEEGWADLAAGLKYVFHRGEGLLASARLVAELPTGEDEVWQGNGDGTLNPAVAVLQRSGKLQLQGTVGYIQALGGEESSSVYDSWHASYELTPGFFPLVELNHQRVTDPGDGSRNFDVQADGAVPSIARFEGVDIVNLGAEHADDHPDYVSLAVGARFRLNERVDLGAAYEFPLTDDENGLTKDRVTVDLVWRL